MIEINLKGSPEDLIKAEQLIIEGKFEEAHHLMDKFKERGEYTTKDALLCNLLKIEIMFQQGLYEDATKLANQTYKKSIALSENLLAFDAFNLEVENLMMLFRSDEVSEKIKEGEELLKILPQDLPRQYKRRRATLEYLKAVLYVYKGDADKVEEHVELCLALFEEIGDNQALAKCLILTSSFYFEVKINYDLALENIEKALVIFKKNDYKFWIASGLNYKGIIYHLKGNIDRSIKLYKQCLTMYKEFNNKYIMAIVLNNMTGNYMIIGDMERALESIESSINTNSEMGNILAVARNYDYLIRILIERGDLEQAQKSLEQLEQMKNQLNDKEINIQFLFDKALVLKTGSRSRNRIEAEDILKQLIEDETINHYRLIDCFLNLCELLLTELRITNDLNVLEEINSYTAQLLTIAEESHSFHLFAEIYFLKAKLALLTLDLKNTRRFLTQAQRIAQRYGFNQLATKISIEHDKLRSQLDIWDDLREEEVSLSERMKLAGMDEHMKYLLQKHISSTTQVKEDQIIVHKERKICIVCKGDILGFMYACNCGALYCEKCARAITEIENACWVCNAQIDITKPIKPYEEEEVGKKDIIRKSHKNQKEDDIP